MPLDNLSVQSVTHSLQAAASEIPANKNDILRFITELGAILIAIQKDDEYIKHNFAITDMPAGIKLSDIINKFNKLCDECCTYCKKTISTLNLEIRLLGPRERYIGLYTPEYLSIRKALESEYVESKKNAEILDKLNDQIRQLLFNRQCTTVEKTYTKINYERSTFTTFFKSFTVSNANKVNEELDYEKDILQLD